MSQPLIVLHVVGRLDIGGAESRIMDLYRNIDREKVQFYFVQHTKDKCAFEDEVLSLGGKVFSVPRFNVKNYITYKKAWEEFFRDHPEIRVVHGHMTSTASIYLPIAKKAGVRTTIAHARSAGVDPGIKGNITRFLRRNLYKKCDYRFTCSGLAGEAVFGNQKDEKRKACFIPNAIEVDKFRFDSNTRNVIRKELGLTDTFVIGHVGRFSAMKNHPFMLQILQQCIKTEEEKRLPKTMLLFLGDGELKEEMMTRASAMGLADRVLFPGNKKDVYRYYQAMDYFLLPSFYEGLPGTVIEAQAGGLRGILSDRVTGEAIVTDLFQHRSITEDAGLWAAEIMKESETMQKALLQAEEGKEENTYLLSRDRYANEVKKASFDIKEQSKRMQDFYIKGYRMEQEVKKIMFHLNSMGKGGAERVVSLLASEFAQKGVEVSIATEWYSEEEYELHPLVRRIHAGLSEKEEQASRIAKQWIRVRNLRRVILREKPDVVLSFCVKANYRAMMATVGTKIPVIVSVRNDPKIDYVGKVNGFMNKAFLNKAAGCVFQTQEAKEFFDPVLQDKSVIICNPVNEKYLHAKWKEAKKKIVCVGRLVAQKNQMLLVNAFERILRAYPDYHLYLYGDGSDDECKEKLLQYVEETILVTGTDGEGTKNAKIFLKDHIHFMGLSSTLEVDLADAAMFVLPSDYEGMPNALMEAMALGLPVISTDCPCGGSRYWIEEHVTGQLVPVKDVAALAKAMEFYITHPEEAENYGKNAKKHLQEATLDKVYQQWYEYIRLVLEQYRK